MHAKLQIEIKLFIYATNLAMKFCSYLACYIFMHFEITIDPSGSIFCLHASLVKIRRTFTMSLTTLLIMQPNSATGYKDD